MPSILVRANQVLFGFVLLVQLLFLTVGPSLFPSYWAANNWSVWMPVYIALTAGAMVGAVFFAGRSGIYSESSSFGDPLGVFPIGLLYFAMGLVASVLLFQIPSLRVTSQSPPGDAFASAMFTIFVIAWTETLLLEWFFINFTWPVLKWASIPASAVAAVGFHLAHYGGDLYSLAFIFVLFNVFGVAYVGTRTLGGMNLPWGLHSGWDLGTFGLVSVRGFEIAWKVLLQILRLVP